jgi:uncharacterized membrane protein (DUF485 family)
MIEVNMSGQKLSRFWRKPASKLGWWAVGLAIAYLVLYIAVTAIVAIRSNLPASASSTGINLGIPMLLIGLAAGVVALVAILAKHERSWAVWLSLLPGILSLLLIVGEFVFPH